MSKILEEYAKIAEEQGLIKESYPMEERRSETLSDIELLYGVKPNGKEDDEDIVDKAHPDVVVVSPSHDKMNGIVENEKQRQDISKYIAMREPNGKYMQRNFITAYENLNNSLVRVGFTLDANNDDELAKYSDNCLANLNKVAIGPLGIALWGVGALLGYTAVFNSSVNPISQGIVNDTQNSIDALREAMSKAYPGTQSEIATLISMLENFHKIALTYLNQSPIPLDVNKANADNVNKLKDDRDSLSKMRLARTYITAVRNLISYLPTAIQSLQNSAEKEDNIGSLLQPFVSLYRAFVPSDLKDSYQHLSTLLDSLKQEEKRISAAMALGQKRQIDLVREMQDLSAGLDEDGTGPLSSLVQQKMGQ